MSAWEESPVKKKIRKWKSKKEKHNRHCVIHVVKTRNKDEVAKFTENSWKVSIKCSFIKKLSFHENLAECYIGVQ